MRFSQLYNRLVENGPAVMPRPGVKPAPTPTRTPSAPPSPKRPGWLPTPTPGTKPKGLLSADEEEEMIQPAPGQPAMGQGDDVAQHDLEILKKRQTPERKHTNSSVFK